MKKILFLAVLLQCAGSGLVRSQSAPVTFTGNVINAIPGMTNIAIPVRVVNFTAIGKFTLTMQFDTTRVRFISATVHPSLNNMSVNYYSPVGNTQGKLIFTWTGSNATNMSLADSSTLSNLLFSYTTGTGMLNWTYTFGSICQYRRYVNGTLTTLPDNPKYLFYKNGGISNRGAPVTLAPTLTPTSSGPVGLPVKVNNFTSIGALTLSMEYNPAIITYQNSFTKNPAFGSSFLVGNVAGSGGNMMIVIQWYGGNVTLANGATICTLNFNYTTAGTATALTWFDNISSCEYADNTGDVLIDMPREAYYINGAVAPPLNADFAAGNLTPLKNETVQFTDLTTGGATTWVWSFDRPSVTFVNGTNAQSQNPQVTFIDGGLYTVTLVTRNAYLSDTITKTGYIRAGSPGLWTGLVSSNWLTPANWDNYQAPEATFTVTIPPVAPSWPVFEGDFTLGIQCYSLIISNSTSQMTVTGNFIIP